MTPTDKIHHGQNIRRFREMLNMKQEALAHELGTEWNQKKVSLLESKETVDQELLEQVAKALHVPVDAIKNFTTEAAYNIISNNSFENCAQPASIFYNSTINPVDKLAEALEENKKLYSQLLQEKDEKIALLQKLLDNK